jgi:hypothetical protein
MLDKDTISHDDLLDSDFLCCFGINHLKIKKEGSFPWLPHGTSTSRAHITTAVNWIAPGPGLK